MATEASSSPQVVQHSADWDREQPPSRYIATAIADSVGVPLTAVEESLYHSLDPATLDRFVAQQPADFVIEFVWEGHTVRIHDGGELVVVEE